MVGELAFVPRVTKINFLPTTTIHHQEKRLGELMKWSTKNCFDLLSNFLIILSGNVWTSVGRICMWIVIGAYRVNKANYISVRHTPLQLTHSWRSVWCWHHRRRNWLRNHCHGFIFWGKCKSWWTRLRMGVSWRILWAVWFRCWRWFTWCQRLDFQTFWLLIGWTCIWNTRKICWMNKTLKKKCLHFAIGKK